MSKKAIIFDLDGTLLDTITDLALSVNHTLQEFGFATHDIDDYKYKVGNGMRKLIERALPENHLNKTDVVLEKFMAYYDEHKADHTRAYEGITELLRELTQKGVKLAVLTNKAHDPAVQLVKKYFGETFDVIHGQKEGVPRKPDATSTFSVMKELDVLAQECLFVGDSAVDIHTAKNAGITSVGVLWGFRTKEELESAGAAHIVSTPKQILNLI